MSVTISRWRAARVLDEWLVGGAGRAALADLARGRGLGRLGRRGGGRRGGGRVADLGLQLGQDVAPLRADLRAAGALGALLALHQAIDQFLAGLVAGRA